MSESEPDGKQQIEVNDTGTSTRIKQTNCGQYKFRYRSMVPSSNRLGNGPLKAEIGVQISMELPVRRVLRDKSIHRANGKMYAKIQYVGAY